MTDTTFSAVPVYSSAENPIYANADKSAVTLDVVFTALGKIPFTASTGDVHDYGRELFSRAVAGDFGTVGDYVETSAEARLAFVANRDVSVAAITVTTSAGNSFDGDENSQNRMARAITSMADTDTITWVLSNNTTLQATKSELQEALKAAGEAQTALWVPTTGSAVSTTS